VLVRRDGERLFLAHLGQQSSFSLKPDWANLLSLIDPYDFVHVSGYFMLSKIRSELPAFLSEARARKAKVSFDPGWDPKGFDQTARTEILRLLSNVNFFEPNESELKAISRKPTIQESIAELCTHYDGIVTVKLGEFGSRIYDNGRGVGEVKSFPTRVIDSTGAGDAFDAGFIHGMVNNQDYLDAARFGNATASILISRKGTGQSRFPILTDVEILTQSNK
jgi:sugar/nucleoside kinase (ribokinase family)